MKSVTRRRVLGSFGLAAGTCVLSSCQSGNQVSSSDKGGWGYPWPYVELDPEATAERAYYAYEKGCMYGVFAPVVKQLAEKRGEPYRSFPVNMMQYGAGGTGGSGSLCGALNGGAALIGLFAGTEERMKKPIGELFLWYEQTELPVYTARKPVSDIDIPKTASHSVLCHVSVSRWCAGSGYKSFGDPRKERCRRLTADAAGKIVEILNARLVGESLSGAELNEDVKKCKSCHTKGSILSNSRGTMNCGSCHFSLAKDHPKIPAT
jgi:hypothetical protein